MVHMVITNAICAKELYGILQSCLLLTSPDLKSICTLNWLTSGSFLQPEDRLNSLISIIKNSASEQKKVLLKKVMAFSHKQRDYLSQQGSKVFCLEQTNDSIILGIFFENILQVIRQFNYESLELKNVISSRYIYGKMRYQTNFETLQNGFKFFFSFSFRA